MRRIHHVVAVLVAVVGAGLLAPVGSAPAAPPPASGWDAPPVGISGTGRHVAGEWVWQDFVYDDGGQLNNEADIVEVRVRPRAGDLVVRVTLNSLLEQSAFAIGVAIEHPAAALQAWPHGAGVQSRWRTLTTATTEATTTTTSDGTAAGAAPVVDRTANTVEVTVPGVGGSAAEVVVAAGRWAAASGAWDGKPADLAFNLQGVEAPFAANEEGRGRNFRNAKQQAAINAGDVSAFVQSVDIAALRAGKTDPATVRTGRSNRVYPTRQDLGEGYSDTFPRHRGLYQPYAIYVPTSYSSDSPVPLALVMHSLNNIHNEYDTELVYEHIAEARGAIAITPLALGVNGWYWDEALVDTLDAWADVRRHYAIDDARTTVSGYSMGGYGSWRLSTLLPDRIAAGAVWAGVPAYQIWAFPAPPVGSPLSRTGPGNTNDQLENLRYIPFMVSHGVNDELVPVAGVTYQTDRLHRLGHSYRYHLHPGYGHGSFRTLNDYTREQTWLAARARVDDPGQVTFKVRPDSWVTPDAAGEKTGTIVGLLDELAAELGGDLRSAYWVRDVQVAAGAGAIGTVDLTSGMRVQSSTTQEHADVRTTPSTHTLRGLDRTDGPPAAVGNTLTGSVAGVTELTIDLARAGLSWDDGRLVIDVTSDRDVTLHLRDGATTHELTIRGSGPSL